MNPQQIAQTYREVGAQGADPIELVVMLYDVLLDDLRRAIEAVRTHDVEKRTFEIQHALRVVEQLQGSLDMDRGGDPARNLDQLYSVVRGKLLEAHWKSSEELLRRQLNMLQPVRDAWQEVRSQQSHPSAPAAPSSMAPPDAGQSAMEWRV